MMWPFKKKKLREMKRAEEKATTYKILSAVCAVLPEEFNYLSRQLEDGVIVVVDEQFFYKAGWRGFFYNPSISGKYENRKCKEFEIGNVTISDFNGEKHPISITVDYGLFAGFLLDVEDLTSVDTSTIDVAGFQITSKENPLEKFFTKAELKYLNPSDLYEVELDDKIYYHLFDLEDGDFIGMDAEKNVYEITHDPYEIVLIKDKLLPFLKKWEADGRSE